MCYEIFWDGRRLWTIIIWVNLHAKLSAALACENEHFVMKWYCICLANKIIRTACHILFCWPKFSLRSFTLSVYYIFHTYTVHINDIALAVVWFVWIYIRLQNIKRSCCSDTKYNMSISQKPWCSYFFSNRHMYSHVSESTCSYLIPGSMIKTV